MTRAKSITYSLIMGILLIAGLYLNYELDRDFLSQFGFSGLFVTVSIIFFISIKILSEFLFFRLRGITKYLVGVFALFTILLSISSIFFVRVWKSESVFQHTKNLNRSIEKTNNEVDTNRKLLLSQINSLDKQINVKQNIISKLNDTNDRWTIYNYNQQIDKLNTHKMVLLKDLKALKSDKVSIEKKETSLHESLNKAFGTDSNNLTIAVNLLFTLFVDGSLILLCFGLSYTLSPTQSKRATEKEETQKEKALPFHNNKVVNLYNQNIQPKHENENAAMRFKTVNNNVNHMVNTSQKMIDPLNILKAHVNQSTQSEVAEKIGVSRVWLNQVLNGKKPLSDSVKEKIEALG